MTDSDTRATGGPGALPPEAFVPATP
ncbi:MAG: hypothetical protein JWM15_4026, partial [Cryptosporangiaceae bacterium]|nr:hypothetical protein [Cryptosporangiaceae bacterium]